MDNLTKQKIIMWEKKMEELQKQMEDTMHQRGAAAAMGDLRENAAYHQLTEEAEVLSARISDIQKMIEALTNPSPKK